MDETSRNNRKSTWPRVMLSIVSALSASFCLAGLATAHGGKGDELNGSALAWVIGLIYIQLVMIPIVGVWLVRQTLNAWLDVSGQIDD